MRWGKTGLGRTTVRRSHGRRRNERREYLKFRVQTSKQVLIGRFDVGRHKDCRRCTSRRIVFLSLRTYMLARCGSCLDAWDFRRVRDIIDEDVESDTRAYRGSRQICLCNRRGRGEEIEDASLFLSRSVCTLGDYIIKSSRSFWVLVGRVVSDGPY